MRTITMLLIVSALLLASAPAVQACEYSALGIPVNCPFVQPAYYGGYGYSGGYYGPYSDAPLWVSHPGDKVAQRIDKSGKRAANFSKADSNCAKEYTQTFKKAGVKVDAAMAHDIMDHCMAIAIQKEPGSQKGTDELTSTLGANLKRK